MDTPSAKFDWNSWYASIPGIPAGWGEHAEVATASLPEDRPNTAEIPLLEAA